MKAITIRQPWAWAICHGGKRIENRDWYCAFRGDLAIHASKGCTRDEYWSGRDTIEVICRCNVPVPPLAQLPRSAVVAVATVARWCNDLGDLWFFGPWGIVLANVRVLPVPVECRGALGLWNLGVDSERLVREQLRRLEGAQQ